MAPRYWHPGQRTGCVAINDFNHDQQQLHRRLAAAGSSTAAMQHLIPLMSPVYHHTPLGLLATRYFVQLFRHGHLDRFSAEDADDYHALH